MLFLAKKTDFFKNRAPKALQKGDFISRVAALGAPLELQADFWFKKWAHNAPKVLPMTEKGFKNYHNRTKNDSKSDSESAFMGDSYTESQICTETEKYFK